MAYGAFLAGEVPAGGRWVYAPKMPHFPGEGDDYRDQVLDYLAREGGAGGEVPAKEYKLTDPKTHTRIPFDGKSDQLLFEMKSE